MSLLAAVAIALLAIGLGLGAERLARGRRASTESAGLGVAFAAGLAALHVGLYTASAVGWKWSNGALVGAALVAAFALAWRRREALAWLRELRPGWGDVVALVALGVLAFYALGLRVVIPDFVFHWGVKGERFFLARGVDWQLLTGFAAWRVHPDYPTLLPELYALTAILGRGFAPAPMMVWSLLFALATVVAGREALARGGAPAWGVQAGSAACGLLVAGFALSHGLVGGADWISAWALVLALPALVGAPDERADWRIGAAAAVAAAGKMEGVPLAAFLVAVHVARSLAAGRRRGGVALPAFARTLVRTLALPALVVGPWLGQCWRLALLQDTNAGALTAARLAVVGRTLLDLLRLGRPWYGLPLLLLLVPWLLARGRSRPAAAVVALQCLFILYAWASPPIDNEFLVRWSADRLFFQLLPALAVLALDTAVAGSGPQLRGAGDAAILRSR